ncbi:MAG: MarR family transcriptional regulator [Candidatus Eremiobacteraeota bacterium]|nr:MarR family transcriptional regulator [Candidatus Eremiobacteraeota bacterium]
MSVEFLSALGTAVRALRSRLDRELQVHGLHVGQHQILRVLWKAEGLTPGEIADRVGVEMPTVTRTVQRLERAGFIRRAAHPADARSVRIYLTDRGRDIRGPVSALLECEARRALRGIAPEQRDALTDALNRVASNLLDDDGEGDRSL